MIESLQSRGKILGLSMGKLVVAEIDGGAIEKFVFLPDLIATVEQLNKVLISHFSIQSDNLRLGFELTASTSKTILAFLIQLHTLNESTLRN